MSIVPQVSLTQKHDQRLEIIGKSKQAVQMRQFAQCAAYSDQIIFLRGETGSGKDHLAEYIHAIGPRCHRFVPIDCGAMPETLCESELFGHSAGAFTDARGAKVGLIQVAEHGTLFLNEVANMSLSLQAKFLRVLDTRTFRPIGEAKEIPINTRIIAATNADVEKIVKEGGLRNDLYHRLNAVTFTIPPLRNRIEDVPLLVDYFLKNLGNNRHFSLAAMGAMEAYPWLGNVRELKHAVERAIFYSGDKEVIEKECLGASFAKSNEEIQEIWKEVIEADPTDGSFPNWEEVQNRVMKKYLIALLKETKGNQALASRISKLSRGTIRERAQIYNIFGDIKID